MSDMEQGALSGSPQVRAPAGRDTVSYTRSNSSVRGGSAVSASSRPTRDVVAISELDGSHPVSKLAQNSPRNTGLTQLSTFMCCRVILA